VDIAKRLGLGASTLNTIFVEKNEIREYRNLVTHTRNEKLASSLYLLNWERCFFTWCQQARASNIPIDETILREKAKTIAAKLNIDCFSASGGWLSRFKDRHGLVFNMLGRGVC
jgi:hypothetical protein